MRRLTAGPFPDGGRDGDAVGAEASRGVRRNLTLAGYGGARRAAAAGRNFWWESQARERSYTKDADRCGD